MNSSFSLDNGLHHLYQVCILSSNQIGINKKGFNNAMMDPCVEIATLLTICATSKSELCDSSLVNERLSAFQWMNKKNREWLYTVDKNNPFQLQNGEEMKEGSEKESSSTLIDGSYAWIRPFLWEGAAARSAVKYVCDAYEVNFIYIYIYIYIYFFVYL